MDVRIVSWNLQGSKGVDVPVVAGVLREMTNGAAIRIVALQEVQKRQVRALARAWGASDWRWARKHLPYGPLWWRAEGLAILADHDLDDHRVTVLTRSVPLWSYRRRILQYALIDAPSPVAMFNTHLASQDAAGERAAQAALVAGEIARNRPSAGGAGAPHEILVGDLNAPDEPGTLSPFLHLGLRDGWQLAGRGPGHTNPASGPYQRLDYVLVGAGLEVQRADVAPLDPPVPWPQLSDHLPLVVSATAGGSPGQ